VNALSYKIEIFYVVLELFCMSFFLIKFICYRVIVQLFMALRLFKSYLGQTAKLTSHFYVTQLLISHSVQV
jgi:hypothetical protein